MAVCTCYMVDRVESNAKFAHFEWVLGFNTLLQVLNTLPVIICEHCIIVGQESWSLKLGQFRFNEGTSSMLPVVQVEVDSSGTCIISILDNLL